MKKSFSQLILPAVLFFLLSTLAAGISQSSVASAAVPGMASPMTTFAIEEGPYKVQDIEHTDDPAIKSGNCANTTNCDLVKKYINPLILLISTLAGIAVTIGIILGGIQYASSGGDPQKAAAGKQHIKVAVVGLIGYLFLYMLLKFLLPNGLIG